MQVELRKPGVTHCVLEGWQSPQSLDMARVQCPHSCYEIIYQGLQAIAGLLVRLVVLQIWLCPGSD